MACIRWLRAVAISTLAIIATGSTVRAGEVEVTDEATGAIFVGSSSHLFGHSVDSFKGLKFATVPERFAVAEEETYSRGERVDGGAFGSPCFQPWPHPTQTNGTEDCLFLNIFRPSNTSSNDGALLPVAFFIHGGGFVHGAGSLSYYDGSRFAVVGDENLAPQNMVVVTINYRLGPLGFLCTAANCSAGGMNGVRDQIMALQWVQRHIRSFGGDPDAVTVFGQSAGGLSTCILTVSPLAKGLFHRAIVQSGSCISRDWGPTNPTQGDSFVLAMLDAVGASSLEDLRNATKFPTEVFVWPKVDGRVGLPTFGDVEAMPVDPREAFAHNDLNVNALLIGATTYDGLATWYPPSFLPKTALEYAALVLEFFSSYSAAERKTIVEQYSPADRFNGSFAASVVQMTGDNDVLCPSLALANLSAASKSAPSVYFYDFGHLYGEDVAVQSGVLTVGVNASNWSSHSGELPFVFGMVNGSAVFPGPWESIDIPFTRAEECLFRSTAGVWASFMQTGVPTFPENGPACANVTTPPSWPSVAGGGDTGVGVVIGQGVSQILPPDFKHHQCNALFQSTTPDWQTQRSDRHGSGASARQRFAMGQYHYVHQ